MTQFFQQTTEYPRIRKAAFALLLFLCVFIPIRSPLAELTTSAIKAIPDGLILLLFIWYLIETRLKIHFLPQDFLFLAFAVAALFSTCVVNGYSIFRYVYQLRSISLFYVLYFVLRDVHLTRRQMIQIVKTLQAMAVVLLVFGAIEKVSFKLIAFSYDVAASIYAPDNYARVYSLFYNPNTFGTFIVFVIFFSMIKTRFWEDKTPAILYAVLITELYLTMSRSSVMILALALLIVLIVDIKQKTLRDKIRRYAQTTILCILCAAVVSTALSAGNRWFYNRYLTDADGKYAMILKSMEYSMKDRLGELGEAYMYDGSTNLRMFYFRTGLEVFQEHPIFGSGFGTYGTSASLNYGSPLYEQYGLQEGFYADDQYITIVAETGAIGTCFFALLLLSILFCYRKNPIKLFFCITFGWFGIFFNIFEIQIAALLFWTALSLEDSLFRAPPAQAASE